MNTREIKIILEKYYRGETSDDEEIALKNYFDMGNVPDEMKEEQQIFSYYTASGKIPDASDGFERKIIKAVEDLDGHKGILKHRKELIAVASIAAGMLLLIGSYLFLQNGSRSGDTFSDPQLAYAETIKILYDVSTRMNKGTQALENVIKFQEATSLGFSVISKSTGTIDRNLKNLDYFQKMFDIADSPLDLGRTK